MGYEHIFTLVNMSQVTHMLLFSAGHLWVQIKAVVKPTVRTVASWVFAFQRGNFTVNAEFSLRLWSRGSLSSSARGDCNHSASVTVIFFKHSCFHATLLRLMSAEHGENVPP